MFVSSLIVTSGLLLAAPNLPAPSFEGAYPNSKPIILAQTQGMDRRQDRRDVVQDERDDVQDNRHDRRDDRQDCRREEGVGHDKRECKQDERQDRVEGN